MNSEVNCLRPAVENTKMRGDRSKNRHGIRPYGTDDARLVLRLRLWVLGTFVQMIATLFYRIHSGHISPHELALSNNFLFLVCSPRVVPHSTTGPQLCVDTQFYYTTNIMNSNVRSYRHGYSSK